MMSDTKIDKRGISMNSKKMTEKIGVTQLSKVKTTGKRYYVSLDRKIVEVYGVNVGDTLLIDVKELFRKPPEEED
jgi:hypothetical protein